VAASPPSAPATPATPARPPSVDEFTDEPALQDVFFEPDRAAIGRSGVRFMRENARWIVENPDYLVLIEGHTDYRGSREGSLATGERGAKVAAGFSSRRVWRTRACEPSTTALTNRCARRRPTLARAKNRCVHFRVKKE
jgi:peptidoglycan-associated lipoprotein